MSNIIQGEQPGFTSEVDLSDPKVKLVSENIGKTFRVNTDLFFDGDTWSAKNEDDERNRSEKIPQGSLLTLDELFKSVRSDMEDVGVTLSDHPDTELSRFDIMVWNMAEILSDGSLSST